jgi:ribonuclease HII
MKKFRIRQQRGKYKFIIGIDEVGRGALAGPVTVCAAAIRKGINVKNIAPEVPFLDSKKLSPRQREIWVQKLREKMKKGEILVFISNISPRVIEKLNISGAVNLGARRCLLKLERKIMFEAAKIFCDGGIFLEKGKTVVKGDEKINAIKIASILAKVHRDKKMVRFGKFYPDYGFEKHKGYGTNFHIKILKKIGLTPIHRKSFCKFL